MRRASRLLALLAALAASACSRPAQQAAAPARPAAQTVQAPPAAPAAQAPTAAQASQGESFPPPAYETAVPPEMRTLIDAPFRGDLDEMVKRRLIRVGAPFNRTFYFIDNGVQRGLAYEYAMLFEDQLNKQLNTGNLRVHVVLLPMSRDQLLPQLRAGKIDMVVAQMTVTPERQKLVDFTNPTRTGVNEVLVTGPSAPSARSFDDLGRGAVYVRRSSSYWPSLQAENQRRAAQGKPTLDVRAAPESLEDDDILEMVNAGLVPATVVDDYLAQFWKQAFPNLQVHEDQALRTGGQLAVAIRKDSPMLQGALNSFIGKYGLNSVFGRTLIQRYLRSTDFVKGAASEADRAKFRQMVDIFRKYGDEYSFDYLLMAAQGYQESRLNQNAKSQVGAVGVMQLMPKTGQAQNVGDIHQIDPNIHAGVKYMRFMRNQYFEGQPMDALNKGLFTFAAYNAGAGRIAQLRREAAQRGLNPNVWFGNVERVASERIGRETVTYVSNIYKYYLAYRLISEEKQRRAKARAALAGPAAG
jgi:membrane-bound lytic murein transglycosylase MltF